MKTTIAILGLMLAATSAHSAQILEKIVWDESSHKSEHVAGEVVSPTRDTRFAQLKVQNPDSKAATVEVCTFSNPKMKEKSYAVTGMVKCEGVEGEAYLEIISVFSDREEFFSRTLGTGTFAPLKGNSGWRRFVLPFHLMKRTDKPVKIVMNVVFRGKGIVYLGPISLVEPAGYASMLGIPGQWWSPTWAARWAGIIGGGFGGLGGLLGALTGIFAWRGRARRMVIGTWAAFVWISAVCLLTGIAALICKQPFWVYYPPLLVGFIGTVVGGPLIPMVRRIYDQAELRKMAVEDAGLSD